ncbi:MAG TPA: serine/threonine-protein kinase [Polyangia bacterium]|nr:serine/threonine-protein kinase [Polyangia bacterium]
MSTTNASLINHTIGNYRVTSLLGEGGMGVVYLAQHPVFGRKVAIKLLHAVLARDPDIVARFFNEARAIHMVAHENIVEILDFGQTADGQPYFIMEFLSGESLTDAISRGPMSPDQVEAIGVQMCRALGAAHAKGIVHRDLKPHNVQLVIKADGALQVKILDFGVAKILQSPDGSSSVKTRTGSLMGTPLYMSPEQCKGAGVLDHRTDIYSLGVILFEMLSGRPPFNAEGVGELFAKHMLEEPPQITEFAPNAPPHMAAAIMKALAKDPAARFQSMDDFRKAIVGEVKVTAPAPTGMKRLPTSPSSTMAQTISARASTTLSSASSEIDEGFDQIKPKRTKLFVGLGGAAALIVGGFVLFKDKAPPPAPPTPVATTTTPAVTPPTPPPAPPVPVKKTVTIRFEAEPAGAHVFRKKDDKDLGVVPVEIQLGKDAAKSGPDALAYVLRLPGYKERPLTADVSMDRTFHISLEKTPAPVDPHHRPPAGGHRPPGGGRHHNPVDEDGLATPSF